MHLRQRIADVFVSREDVVDVFFESHLVEKSTRHSLKLFADVIGGKSLYP